MSAASMLVWERRLISPALVKKALFAYAGTLCLNFSFNPFIISKNVLVATLIQAISLPWNIFTAWSFYRVAPSAGYLMVIGLEVIALDNLLMSVMLDAQCHLFFLLSSNMHCCLCHE